MAWTIEVRANRGVLARFGTQQVMISNLPFDTTKEELEAFAGQVRACWVWRREGGGV